MPGIAGFIKGHPQGDDRSRLERMLGSMMHEPFYVSGTCIRAEVGVSAGWVARNDSGQRCAWNEAVNIALVLSGELFPDTAQRQSLLRNLIALYEKRGPGFLAELNGWFSRLLLHLP